MDFWHSVKSHAGPALINRCFVLVFCFVFLHFLISLNCHVVISHHHQVIIKLDLNSNVLANQLLVQNTYKCNGTAMYDCVATEAPKNKNKCFQSNYIVHWLKKSKNRIQRIVKKQICSSRWDVHACFSDSRNCWCALWKSRCSSDSQTMGGNYRGRPTPVSTSEMGAQEHPKWHFVKSA